MFTNPTGSNFVRGVVSALLTEVTLGGKLDADIAVLELDEAYAVHFVKQVKPRYELLLNVMSTSLTDSVKSTPRPNCSAMWLRRLPALWY